jgi:hypothetical protein
MAYGLKMLMRLFPELALLIYQRTVAKKGCKAD